MAQSILPFLDTARLALLFIAGAGIVLHIDPTAADPLSPKSFWFSLASGALAGLTAARLWWWVRLELPPRRFLIALACILLTALLSFLNSHSRPLTEPAFNAWLLLAAFFLCAYDLLNTPLRRNLLLHFLGACLALAVATAFLPGPRAFGWRLSGSFGNPNFLAGFLVLLLPMAFWLSINVHRAFALLSLAALALLLFTGSKAALLGLAFQYFAFGHLGWHSDRPLEWRRRFLKRWAIAGLAGLALGLALSPNLRSRLADGFSLKHESIQFRLNTWKGAVGVWRAKPLTGHGPGSFAAVYPAHRPVQAMASQVQHSYEVTHPENWLLQLASELGLPGLAALLAFFFLIGRPLWEQAHAWSAEGLDDTWLALGLGGSLVTNLASLDLFLPSTFFFFTLMAALALRRAGGPAFAIRINAGRFFSIVVSALILLLSLAPASQALARWRASRDLQQAKSLSSAASWKEALAAYDSALSRDPMNPESLYFKSATLLDSGDPAAALTGFETLQSLAPDYVLVHDKKARALKSLGKMDQAAAEWERQLALDPWYLPAVQELASLYASQGRLADALRVLEAAAARIPANPDIARNLEPLRKRTRP